MEEGWELEKFEKMEIGKVRYSPLEESIEEERRSNVLIIITTMTMTMVQAFLTYMARFCSRKFEEKRFSWIEIQIQNGTMGKSPVRINWPIIWREMREADHQSWFKGRLRRCVWNRVGSIIGSRLRIQFSAAPPFTATSRLFAYNDRLHWHFDDQLWVKRSTSLSSNTRAFRSVHARVCGTSGNQRSRKAHKRRAENNSFWIYRLDGESSGIYGVWRPSIQTRYD